MTTLPLDVENLLAELDDPAAEPFDGLPDGTTSGTSTCASPTSRRRSSSTGTCSEWTLMAQLGPTAAFLSAGGYHHHVGGNTWETPWRSARRRLDSPRSGTRRSSCRTRPSATGVAARVADSGQEPEALAGGVLVRDPSGTRSLLTA